MCYKDVLVNVSAKNILSPCFCPPHTSLIYRRQEERLHLQKSGKGQGKFRGELLRENNCAVAIQDLPYFNARLGEMGGGVKSHILQAGDLKRYWRKAFPLVALTLLICRYIKIFLVNRKKKNPPGLATTFELIYFDNFPITFWQKLLLGPSWQFVSCYT